MKLPVWPMWEGLWLICGVRMRAYLLNKALKNATDLLKLT